MPPRLEFKLKLSWPAHRASQLSGLIGLNASIDQQEGATLSRKGLARPSGAVRHLLKLADDVEEAGGRKIASFGFGEKAASLQALNITVRIGREASGLQVGQLHLASSKGLPRRATSKETNRTAC